MTYPEPSTLTWLTRAASTTDAEEFLTLAFPPAWAGIAARIIESGVEFERTSSHGWAPRWSRVPLAVRKGSTDGETALKSVLFRVHDCLHQLWGLPYPGTTTDDACYYKRVQMCGEVAVLTLEEFRYCAYLRRIYPGLRVWLEKRHALPMLDGPLAGRTTEQIAARLDDLLHKKRRPRWVRNSPQATAFVDDYVPMLEVDREQSSSNWRLMKAAGWTPDGAPRARFGRDLDGLELTTWMIRDFEHLLSSTPDVDGALAEFNRQRRAGIVLPDGWLS